MTQPAGSASRILDMTGSNNDSISSGDSPEFECATTKHGMDVLHLSESKSSPGLSIVEYPPPIPVALRHPHLVASVKQYRSEAQQQQLKQHIVSESFIPVAPDTVKPPRRRRRPPFSYSSLIAQAILASDDERLTLREIYKWIMEKYPALYDANDTGWQNTIRHNLSLNKCFRKVPKGEPEGVASAGRGKGGYWMVDPAQMAKFKDGCFVRGSASATSRRKGPREIRMKTASTDSSQPSPSSSTDPEFPASALSPPASPLQQQAPSIPSSSSRVMQIQNLLN